MELKKPAVFKTNPQKKRAPIAQLKEAGNRAFALLVEKRVVHHRNVLEDIARDANAPILPGIPSYLPHRWTIDAARQAMFVLMEEWIKENDGNEEMQEKAPDFFYFVVKRMKLKEREYKREVKREEFKAFSNMKEARLISDIFSPVRKHQTAKGLNKFFVDSFAIFIIVKAQGTTTEYAEWFLGEWTPSLYKLWSNQKANEQKK